MRSVIKVFLFVSIEMRVACPLFQGQLNPLLAQVTNQKDACLKCHAQKFV